MTAITLGPVTPSSVRAFGLTLILLAAIAGFLLGMAVLPSLYALLVGMLSGGLVLAASLAMPSLAVIAYKAWNRFGRLYARTARSLVNAACFFVVISGTANAGSSLALERRKGQSLWTPHASHDSKPSVSQYVGGTGREASGFRSFVEWARRSGNLWALALIPFFCLLLALEAEGDYQAPSDIYTLF